MDNFREEFPIINNFIYLDHAGVSPISLRVKKAITNFLSEASGETGFDYSSWGKRIEEIRASCAELIGADADEIAFVKNTSHGISIVASGLDWKQGDNVIVFEKEFSSNIYPWLNLKDRGVEVRFVPLKNERILFEDIESLIDSRTRLITMSSVQSINGFMIDINRLGKLCQNNGILFFVDAIQSLGAVSIDVKECGADFLSADGHKWLLAPEGIGIFYCKRERASKIMPNLLGWKSVKNDHNFESFDFELKDNALRFEEGSFNTIGIYGLGAAVDLLLEVGVDRIETRVRELGDLIISETERRGLTLKTPKNPNERGGIISFGGNFDPKEIAEKLFEKNIVVNYRGGGLRVAPHFYNTEDEILKLFEALDELLI
ncbi:MAG: aminotransferase class V-fold PLP-dependent enzyme [Thermodesulfobacteriales bacterium]|nr:MAG: aminotransferase class V-fold PLP-dependent enzyme [Thermodesulfobacteriales bacterium]